MSKPFLWWGMGALILASLPALLFPKSQWVYDDQGIAKLNQSVRAHDFGAIWTQPYWGGVEKPYVDENLFRPIFLSTFALFQDSPSLLHGITFVSHLAVSAAIFLLLLRRLRKRVRFAQSWGLVGAFLFAIHPATVEVSAQAVGLMETLPCLLGLAAFLVGSTFPGLAFILVSSAVGWKETGFIWQGLFVWFFWVRDRKKYAIATAVAITGWLFARYFIYGELFGFHETPYRILNPLVGMDAVDGFFSRWALLGHYFKNYVFPFWLSSDYGEGTLPLPGYAIQVWTLGGMVLTALLFVCQKWVFQKWDADCKSGAFLARCALLLSILPALHIVTPLACIFADRFAYSFYAGLTLVWVEIAARYESLLERKMKNQVFKIFGFLIVILVLGCDYVKTLERNQLWMSREALFRADSRLYPQNAKLHFNLGVSLGEQKRWFETIEELKKAVALAPDFPEAHLRLGLAYGYVGDEPNRKWHLQRAKVLGYLTPD